MALAPWTHDITDESGNLQSNVTVKLRPESGATMPQLYSDFDGVSALGNPFTSPDGMVRLHTVGGFYKVILNEGLPDERTLRYQPIGLAAATDLTLTQPAGQYSAVVTYTRGQWVRHGGYGFASKVNDNLNNTPDIVTPGDTASWMFLGDMSVINPADAVTSSTVNVIAQLTQAEYDALGAADPATLYVIVG